MGAMPPMLRWLLVCGLLSGCAAPPTTAVANLAASPTSEATTLEWVQVAADGKGFVLSPSGTRFVAWGFNYTVDEHNRLLEDYWDEEWSKVEADFREMKALRANVVRVFLQVGKFMDDPATPNAHALDQLARLVALAEQTGLYLDLTGLGVARASDVPAWYFTLSEAERWDTHARFWAAVAERIADSPAVFCFNLMNEPIAPAGTKAPEEVIDGELGGFHFVQYLSLEQAGRPLPEIARQWIRHLTAAIRKHDTRHMITVGALPPSPTLGYLSGFEPKEIVDELDFLSVHVYPEKDRIPEAIAIVQAFAVAKPVVVEETSQLYCGPVQMEQFILGSEESASGWMGLYSGESVAELTPPEDMRQSINLLWLELFQKLTDQVLE